MVGLREGGRGLADLGVAGECCFDFFVDDDVDFDAALGCCFEHVVYSVFLVLGRRPSEVELGTQPPVQDENLLLRLCRLRSVTNSVSQIPTTTNSSYCMGSS